MTGLTVGVIGQHWLLKCKCLTDRLVTVYAYRGQASAKVLLQEVCNVAVESIASVNLIEHICALKFRVER